MPGENRRCETGPSGWESPRKLIAELNDSSLLDYSGRAGRIIPGP
jgi:hypothetical protein